jgi:hypothetical protein
MLGCGRVYKEGGDRDNVFWLCLRCTGWFIIPLGFAAYSCCRLTRCLLVSAFWITSRVGPSSTILFSGFIVFLSFFNNNNINMDKNRIENLTFIHDYWKHLSLVN